MAILNNAFERDLSKKLEKRKRDDAFRSLPESSNLVDFYSNDYLGFARSEDLHDLFLEKLKSMPKRNGATGSRLLSGNDAYTTEVERKLANFFESESSLIFNSGYSANLAVLSSIPQRNDTLVYDELVHASIKDGARLSLASRVSFRHNDMEDLENKIARAKRRVFIVVESIYSMDGDAANLPGITELAEKYSCTVILDEAHSTGVVGPGGSGMAISMKLSKKVDIRIYTFGKGMGVHGACVCGTKKLIDYLINFARPFIYTTALPPHSIIAIDSAFDYLKNNQPIIETLSARIQFYNRLAREYGIGKANGSAIQTYHVPGNALVKATSQKLREKGVDVKPILSPTVKEGTERLRICLHTFNTESDIRNLITNLRQV